MITNISILLSSTVNNVYAKAVLKKQLGAGMRFEAVFYIISPSADSRVAQLQGSHVRYPFAGECT